ncbi:Ig-like domain-containing protein [Candidatus Uhrbacteria bacterium]|nr:Ig-like domain-containing protein [Candidatus Uhrbacteria bacterium]
MSYSILSVPSFKSLIPEGRGKRAFSTLFLIASLVLVSMFIVAGVSRAGVPTLSGGGPQNGQEFVPDLALVDITGSENLSSATVNTTNVTLYSCTGATDATACATPNTAANLCTAVTLDNNTRIVCDHAALAASTTFRFQIGTGVQSSTNDALASAVTRIFRTGTVMAGTNTTPPRVMGTTPGPGIAFPAGGNLIVMFPTGPDGNMNFGAVTPVAGDLNFFQNNQGAISIKKIENFVPTTEVCTNSTTCALSWNAVTRELTVNPASNLEVASGTAAPIEYDLCVRGSGNTFAVKNSANQNLMGDYCMRFRTAAADSTAPALAASAPTTPVDGATNVSPLGLLLDVRFGETLDPSTVSLSTVRLCQDSTAGTAGCEAGDTRLTDVTKFTISYDDIAKEVGLDPITGDALAASTKYCIEIVGGASGVKDLSGNAVTATSSANCFTTGLSTDPVSGGPKVSYIDADNYKAVVHFNEAMRSADLITSGNVNTSNVSLECPTGVAIALTGKAATYRSEFKELEISGLGLPQDQTCRITVTTARDLAGNAMDTASNNNRGDFKVLNAATTGGFLGGGATASNDFFGGMGGQTAATFWEKPMRCQPRNVAVNKGTSLECEFPAPGAMPVSSTVLLTFPSGFTLSTGDGNARIVPTTLSQWNTDLNGPESGTVTATAVTDTGAKTITLTTVGAAIGNGAMVHFELDRLTTPTTPGENLRVSIVVKDNSGVKIGQTINPAPFSIQQGGSLSISGTVCKGTTSGGTCGVGDTGIASVKVFCNQMGGFVVGAASSAFMGFQEATTDASGDWSITGLTAGEYSCNIPPDPTRLADVGGSPPFQPITLSNANRTDVDTKYKNMATASDAKTLTVNISGGPASTEVDVFCSAGGFDFQFSAPSMKSVTLGADGSGTTTLKLQQDKNYDCGMGPHMAFEQFGSGGPPPMPTFTFMPPKPQIVNMDADKAITFALQSTNRTITGTVVDGSSNGIANVFVHAEPVGCFDATSGEFKDCHGAFAQTKSDGTFSLAVVDGTYEVGADGPGLPPSTRQIANVKGVNVTGVTLKMVKSSTTISGAIQDESGNGIQYAHVSAEKRTITTGSDACDFSNSRPSGGFADSPTDSSGNFTLYVSNGTWCIRAFAPSYGEVGTKTVTMAGTSLTGQNIAATSTGFGTVTGTVTKAGSNVSGAFVNCYGSNGGNGGQTGSNGVYSIKVKLAGSGSTSMTCDGFAPGVGPLGRATVTFASGDTSKTQNFTVAGNPGTITVTATGLTEGFCDARDSAGLGSGAPIQSGTATIKAPAGTYTVRCGSPRTGPLTLGSSSATLTAGSTTAITATVPTLRTVAGRITDGTSNLEGVTATFTDTTTKSSFKVVTGNQSGTNNNLSGSNVPEGVYNVMVSKKGYESAATTASVSGGNLTMSSAVALTPTSATAGEIITIPVQESSAAYTGVATVIATKGNSVVVGKIDSTTGNASLDLTNGVWSVKAVGDNGKQSTASTVTVSGGALSGSAPTLALDNSISGYTQKSGSGTFGLSSGGLMKFNDLAVSGTAPEINVPTNAFSTTDSSTGKVEMKSDPTLKDIDPGLDQNFVGGHGYDITPQDANGKKVSDTNSPVTITMPYTDADVSSAGVAEAKLQLASYNTSSQTWETVATTVDTTNNLLIASVSHFSSFGIIGGVVTTAGSSSDLTPPGAPTNVRATSNGTSVTLTWTDPTDTDLSRIEILRNDGNGTAVTGEMRAPVLKGVRQYVDSTVAAGKTYKYILKSRDTSNNQRLSEEVSIAVAAAASSTVTAPAPAAATPATTATPAATTGTTAATPAAATAAAPAPSVSQTPPIEGVSVEVLRSGTHAYGAARVRALSTEQGLARGLSKDLNIVLPGVFNRLFHQKTAQSKSWWYTYVNAYTYGGYNMDEIKQSVRFGGKTVHPTIPASAWRGAADYKAYINK